MNDLDLICLYRRGKTEHVEALLKKGEVFINHIKYIRKCDENGERSDPSDGIHSRDFFESGKIEIRPLGVPEEESLSFEAINIITSTDHDIHGHIYCMSMIRQSHFTGTSKTHKFDTSSFGEAIILITNPAEFLNRLVAALKKSGNENVFYRPVNYYPNYYSGPVGFFGKHERFKGQNEFRIFVPNIVEHPIKVTIGSLEDIAVMNEMGFALKSIHSDRTEEFIYI